MYIYNNVHTRVYNNVRVYNNDYIISNVHACAHAYKYNIYYI